MILVLLCMQMRSQLDFPEKPHSLVLWGKWKPSVTNSLILYYLPWWLSGNLTHICINNHLSQVMVGPKLLYKMPAIMPWANPLFCCFLEYWRAFMLMAATKSLGLVSYICSRCCWGNSMAKSRPRGMSTKENYKAGGRSSELAKAVFSVDGMICSPSIEAIEEALRRLQGIREALFDLLNNKVQVLYYPSSINVSLNYTYNCYIIEMLWYWKSAFKLVKACNDWFSLSLQVVAFFVLIWCNVCF